MFAKLFQVFQLSRHPVVSNPEVVNNKAMLRVNSPRLLVRSRGRKEMSGVEWSGVGCGENGSNLAFPSLSHFNESSE